MDTTPLESWRQSVQPLYETDVTSRATGWREQERQRASDRMNAICFMEDEVILPE
jgi:hypothetical protein